MHWRPKALCRGGCRPPYQEAIALMRRPHRLALRRRPHCLPCVSVCRPAAPRARDPALFRVVHDDGDEEDLEESEVRQ